MTLSQWLRFQESVHARSIDLGLERVAEVARRLDLLSLPCQVITVAGTNGKGSTVTFLDAVARAVGHHTGTLTSPHLLRYNERVRIDGAQATDEQLVDTFERIEHARGRTTLTFFEYNTLAALLLFVDAGVDLAVLEVGLGGRLDATNVVDADVGVLCSVGFDHRDWLGDTLEQIGAEKAGIFRERRPAVLGSAEMPASVYSTIERLGAQAIIAERDFGWIIEAHEWTYRGIGATLEHLATPALAGAIQFRNAATALAAYESLQGGHPLSSDAVSAALASARLAGRFEILRGPAAEPSGELEWIVDVAHNEPAARVLAENLRARPVSGRTLGVVSVLRDKDVEAVGRALRGVIDEWIVSAVSVDRGLSAPELASRLAASAPNPLLAENVAQGCDLARSRAHPGDRVVVFGSFVTVGLALEWLGYTALP